MSPKAQKSSSKITTGTLRLRFLPAEVTMKRTAIISVDGHVKASRVGYRDYIAKRYHADYDADVKRLEDPNVPDSGNLHPDYPAADQWDSQARLGALEKVGCVAEVLFPNGQPFQLNLFDDYARAQSPELALEGRNAYNRWLVDFCAEAKGRRAGQMVTSFSDIDAAVADVYWAKEHGLGGMMMPPLHPGDTYFFDRALDPFWAACQETGLTICQHGGGGLPDYQPPGLPAIMTMALENGFFSGRSLWQMILGGVFDRFPALKVAWIETSVAIPLAVMNMLAMLLAMPENDFFAFAALLGHDTRLVERPPSEYMGRNVFIGISPFRAAQTPFDQLLGRSQDPNPPGLSFGVDAVMYGIDYPHFESVYHTNHDQLSLLASHRAVDAGDVEKIVFANAAGVFGFDAGVLKPHIERAGFDVGSLVPQGLG
jgi:predicted TIM-barrel fold metal-dependent hydrolase